MLDYKAGDITFAAKRHYEKITPFFEQASRELNPEGKSLREAESGLIMKVTALAQKLMKEHALKIIEKINQEENDDTNNSPTYGRWHEDDDIPF